MKRHFIAVAGAIWTVTGCVDTPQEGRRGMQGDETEYEIVATPEDYETRVGSPSLATEKAELVEEILKRLPAEDREITRVELQKDFGATPVRVYGDATLADLLTRFVSIRQAEINARSTASGDPDGDAADWSESAGAND